MSVRPFARFGPLEGRGAQLWGTAFGYRTQRVKPLGFTLGAWARGGMLRPDSKLFVANHAALLADMLGHGQPTSSVREREDRERVQWGYSPAPHVGAVAPIAA
jgi:hypothetical protein